MKLMNMGGWLFAHLAKDEIKFFSFITYLSSTGDFIDINTKHLTIAFFFTFNLENQIYVLCLLKLDI